LKTDFSALCKIVLLSVPTDFKSLTGNDRRKFNIKRFWIRKMMKNKTEIKANSVSYLQEILNCQNKNPCISNRRREGQFNLCWWLLRSYFKLEIFHVLVEVYSLMYLLLFLMQNMMMLRILKLWTKFKHFFHLLLILVYLLCWNIVKDFFRYWRWYLPLYTYRN